MDKKKNRVYCVINDDGYVQEIFRIKENAIEYCKREMVEQLLDPRDWECYFRIDESEIK